MKQMIRIVFLALLDCASALRESGNTVTIHVEPDDFGGDLGFGDEDEETEYEDDNWGFMTTPAPVSEAVKSERMKYLESLSPSAWTWTNMKGDICKAMREAADKRKKAGIKVKKSKKKGTFLNKPEENKVIDQAEVAAIIAIMKRVTGSKHFYHMNACSHVDRYQKGEDNQYFCKTAFQLAQLLDNSSPVYFPTFTKTNPATLSFGLAMCYYDETNGVCYQPGIWEDHTIGNIFGCPRPCHTGEGRGMRHLVEPLKADCNYGEEEDV